jgi:hypothetical protein
MKEKDEKDRVSGKDKRASGQACERASGQDRVTGDGCRVTGDGEKK